MRILKIIFMWFQDVLFYQSIRGIDMKYIGMDEIFYLCILNVVYLYEIVYIKF